MTRPGPGPFRPRLDAAVADVALQVNRENVLKARAVLLAEADRLDDVIDNNLQHGLGIGLCGGDPVSKDAQKAFNERIDGLVQHCRTYNRDLREAAHALDDVARRYGYTEEEIAASFVSDR
ncbi:WXG100 family type VII secretion target [Pseudonocardia sp. TRM90224]|uniref:WXG100 family type VII secretion target n=1 Tax=Pseudonocardia sp. TRM90224 TaxID=2812678 RepID=UPI001E5A79D9|nr:hypothetical protein [Pseudonocardia sp. TRM90224]